MSAIGGGVTVQSGMFSGCLKTARNHVISVKLLNLKLLVSSMCKFLGK